MNPDPTSLDRLHDIIVPAPLPWWPPAPGWLWVIAAIAIILVVFLIKGFIRWQQNRYRREALAELALHEANLRQHGSRPAALLAIADLLKRTALTAYPRERVADLTGAPWFEFLDRNGGTNFSAGPGEALSRMIYRPQDPPLDEQTFTEIVDLTRMWIRHHVPLSSPPTSEHSMEIAHPSC